MELMNPLITMSSLELVAFINDSRKSGEPILRHDSFMAKVPNVLGPRKKRKFQHFYGSRKRNT